MGRGFKCAAACCRGGEALSAGCREQRCAQQGAAGERVLSAQRLELSTQLGALNGLRGDRRYERSGELPGGSKHAAWARGGGGGNLRIAI